ncbi:MAG: TFIIB-type zinc ribbon-containing protein [Nanobdellota archaeon]
MPKKYMKICPVCGSTNITKDDNNTPALYVCTSCRHKSYIFPEVESKDVQYYQKQVIKGIRSSGPENYIYAPFEVSIVWNTIGALLLVSGIIGFLMMENQQIPLLIPSVMIGISLFMVYITYLTKK